MSRRAWIPVAALAGASLVFAAVALAATPKPGNYRGKTSQGRHVRVKVSDAGRIARDGFKIHWEARCQEDPTKSWTDTTHNTKSLGISDSGRFELKGKYKHKVGDYTGHIKVFGEGKFDTKTSARGKFRATVRVTRDGDYVDTCKQPITWSVSK